MKRTHSAFTLLELILVMVILTTALAVAAPALRDFFSVRRTDHAAAQVLALTRYARETAINDGRVLRLNFDEIEGVYWLTEQDGGTYAELKTDFGRKFELPDGTTATLEVEASDTHRDYVEFFPDGRTEASTLSLTDRRDATVRVTCPSATEFFRIETGGGE